MLEERETDRQTDTDNLNSQTLSVLSLFVPRQKISDPFSSLFFISALFLLMVSATGAWAEGVPQHLGLWPWDIGAPWILICSKNYEEQESFCWVSNSKWCFNYHFPSLFLFLLNSWVVNLGSYWERMGMPEEDWCKGGTSPFFVWSSQNREFPHIMSWSCKLWL